MDWARRIELVAVVIASLVAVASLWYSNTQVREELAVSRDTQVTGMYTAAVTSLGDDSPDARLGGVYALQRIMEDSPRDQGTSDPRSAENTPGVVIKEHPVGI